MCGIVAVLRRAPSGVPIESLEREMVSLQGLARGSSPLGLAGEELISWLETTSERMEGVGAALKTDGGFLGLVASSKVRTIVEESCESLTGWSSELEKALDDGRVELAPGLLEQANASLIRLKDVIWAVGVDRLESARAVVDLAGGNENPAAHLALLSVQHVLSALDRLEVRGRDSAGVNLMIWGHDLDLESSEVRSLTHRGPENELYTNGGVRVFDGVLSIVYKCAAEIGELGDNVRSLRRAISEDRLLRLALRSGSVELAALGHTRWASVGMISEPNAHPLNQELRGRSPINSSVAALNGDVDNYADLKAREQLDFPEEITTDAKVIPAMFSSRIDRGLEPLVAFTETVSSFVGSVAVGAATASQPDRLFLALRGSGQALYVGLAENAYIVASEPYGLVEVTDTYLRLDGERQADPDDPNSVRGQVVVLDGQQAGSIDGIERCAYDGTRLPVESSDLQQVEITTRDIDRGDHPHFLLKEISEAPASFRKTLRGKIRDSGEGLRVVLDDQTLVPEVVEIVRSPRLRRILVIGQGTAAVAGLGVAEALRDVLGSRLPDCEIRALPATELSGFQLADDMSDTLIVAISQSGTTTDTNRTVDLVRARGARVLAIVNRRHSDLTDKADGVLYTSDGRDVEMSVASTKAFYSQIAAGWLLALALAELTDRPELDAREQELVRALVAMPDAMVQTLELHGAIDEIAKRHAPRRRYWAIVGNGSNRTAAEEIRIKLSELCYKSIACDATEDKKHIDLSSEPLILVCAAGLAGSTVDDVSKEVAIYRAHKACPIVIANVDETRFDAAVDLIAVPKVSTALDYVLAAVVGHLFGYSAARAIDAQAHPLREIRTEIEHLASAQSTQQGSNLLAELSSRIQSSSQRYLAGLEEGSYDGHLEASAASELSLLLHFASGVLPLDAFAALKGRAGSPAIVVEELGESLSRAIDQLTRPIDAIKHQAKTVTVGISRTDEALLMVPLVRSTLERGASRDRLQYSDLRTLAALDPLVEEVTGHSRYRIEGDPGEEDCRIYPVDSGGLSRDIATRTQSDHRLRGTKRSVAVDRRVLLARGRLDGRLFLLIPEVEGGSTRGLLLIHIRLAEAARRGTLKAALEGYRNRFAQLRDAVTETEPTFREDLLERLTVEEALLSPIGRLAERWRVAPRPAIEGSLER